MTQPLDERLLEATTGALELFGMYLGNRLGLYAALAEQGPLNPGALAEAAGIAPRYATEWLEQQAVAGFLTVEDVAAQADARRYTLPAEHAGILLDPDDPAHLAPFAELVLGIAGRLDDVAAAYRTGGGVPYATYGETFRRGQGGINRPAFSTDLTGSWLPALPDLHERLARPGARIADLGCGHGWSTRALAAAYPDADVLGLDLDDATIEEARRLTATSAAPVRFAVGSAADLGAAGPFDAVLILEALHDMSQPVEVLRGCRQALAQDGSVIVADEMVADQFTAPGDVVERMMYGWSITHCLPAAMAETPSAALGTVLRSPVALDLARQAGFRRPEATDIDAGFFRIYRFG